MRVELATHRNYWPGHLMARNKENDISVPSHHNCGNTSRASQVQFSCRNEVGQLKPKVHAVKGVG